MAEKTRVLIDWKTGGFVAPEWRMQLAAYWGCLDDPRPGHAIVIQVNKDGCKPAIILDQHALEEGFEAFTHAKSVFDYQVRLGNITITANEAYRFDVDGQEQYLPSVTYILHHILAKPGLMKWYARMAREGKDPESVRDEKAEQGKTLHHVIQLLLEGKHFSFDESPEWLARGITHFSGWLIRTKFEPMAMEQKVFHKVLKYAGTLDAVGMILTEAINNQEAHG